MTKNFCKRCGKGCQIIFRKWYIHSDTGAKVVAPGKAFPIPFCDCKTSNAVRHYVKMSLTACFRGRIKATPHLLLFYQPKFFEKTSHPNIQPSNRAFVPLCANNSHTKARRHGLEIARHSSPPSPPAYFFLASICERAVCRKYQPFSPRRNVETPAGKEF
jgi:hypothetical protein